MRKSLILLLFACGCASTAIPPDPCSLLTKEEISAVQDATFLDATKNLHTSGDVTVSQCYFRLPDPSRSITLELTTARNLHELWFNVILVLVILHVAAIIFYRLRGKHLTKPMITGRAMLTPGTW